MRWLIRRNIRLLNDGNYKPTLGMFAADAALAFPGNNTWSAQYREPVLGRDAFVSHRGRDEIEAFLERYVGTGMYMEIEDILVNGPPWNTRAAVRVHHWIRGAGNVDVYCNRAVLMVRTTWGKISAQEDYEDTERVTAYDRLQSSLGPPG